MAATDMLAEDDIARLRRELERLRAENVRLSRLLELRGQDTAPAPEQLAAAVTAPGPVTMASRSADKLALHADLVKARTDVYAVRWENARTRASGWMPAVAGGWRKGMDRRGVAYLPLTAEVVAAHLVGDVFIGLYPLRTGNTCHVLASVGTTSPSTTASSSPADSGHTIAAIVERAGSGLAVADVRNPGQEVDLTFTAEFNTKQAVAVSALLTHDDGVLVAPPGGDSQAKRL